MYYDNIVNRDRDALVSVSTPNDKLRKTLVVGLGNPILGDDGVGWRVAKSLMKICPQIEVDCLALGGLSLMERLIGYRQVIIVDAVQTQEAQIGKVFCFGLDELTDLSAGHTTAAHDTSLQTALKVGRAMGAQLPEDVFIVGIEANRVYDFSEELSPEVEAAIPMATEAIINILKKYGLK
jgi:hydrogenase maturation protease